MTPRRARVVIVACLRRPYFSVLYFYNNFFFRHRAPTTKFKYNIIASSRYPPLTVLRIHIYYIYLRHNPHRKAAVR